MERDPRHRLRWWLRGEQALGLRFVSTPRDAFTRVAESVSADPHGGSDAAALQRFGQSKPSISGMGNFPSNQSHPPRVESVTSAAPSDHESFESTPTTVQVPSDDISLARASRKQVAIASAADLGPIVAGELSSDEKSEALRILDETSVKGCTLCNLCRTRRNTVFGEGHPSAQLMFVGEGPGYTEDATGKPFVGRAGHKLTEMIAAMKLSRDQVYICNVVKCRAFLAGPPAKDRPPLPEEVAACMPYLSRQIEIVRPSVIVTLGLSATQSLLSVKQTMSRLRGQWQSWRGIRVMPTFHPSYILRNPTVETRRAVWDDLKLVMQELNNPGG